MYDDYIIIALRVVYPISFLVEALESIKFSWKGFFDTWIDPL